jgi:hypothetical protein
MDGRKNTTELAALLDGEVTGREAEELYARLQADPALAAEYEQQRSVKAALAQLARHEAPDFFETRVLGEIAQRRKELRRWRPRSWAAALGGFAVCLLTLGLFGGLQLAGGGSGLIAAHKVLVQPGVFSDVNDIYTPQNWKEIQVPDNLEPQAKSFLEFVRDQHGYRRMQHAAEAYTPNMAEAILVLGDQQAAPAEGQQ